MADKDTILLKQIVSGGHARWNDGEFYLWNIPGIIFPVYTYSNLIHNLKQNCKETNKILYAIGERQTILALDYMTQKFGFKRPIEAINSILHQAVFLGFGSFKLIKADIKTGHAIFKNENNPYAKSYKLQFGQTKDPVDAYFAGTKAGIMEALTGKTLIAIETNCLACGDSCCLFEVKSPDRIDKKFQNIIYSNYLGPDKIRKQLIKEQRIVSASH